MLLVGLLVSHELVQRNSTVLLKEWVSIVKSARSSKVTDKKNILVQKSIFRDQFYYFLVFSSTDAVIIFTVSGF